MGRVQCRRVRVTRLDPQLKCGLGTTVEQLYRVEERGADAIVTHLVFLDRHGWYCQHGSTCPAVADVRRQLRPSTQTRPAVPRTKGARGA